jgi:hypothetical protein
MKTFGIVIACIFGFFLLLGLGFVCNVGGIFTGHALKSAQDAVINYDNYQDTYNTCVKLNQDLAIIQNTPDNDKQFEQFSKAQRINAIKTNLNRWVEDYNSKSKQIDKNLWKSGALPYQLSVNDFSNYNK